MICLTGDLHHATLRTGNQRAADDSEVRIAARYLRMLEEARVKVTFFVSGRAFVEEWPDLAPIAASESVEIGGHNYSCFEPALLHRFSKKLLGSYPGPRWYEEREVGRTVDVIARRTGRRIRAWRNHMYMHGPNTERALAAHGIEVCSDGVRARSAGPTLHPSGVWDLPLNVIPDHEHLFHAERTPAWVAAWQRRYRFADDFGKDSYHVEEWTDLVLEQLASNEARGAISTMIVHPITLYLCDRFRSFRRILDHLSSRESLFVSDVVARARRGRLEEAA